MGLPMVSPGLKYPFAMSLVADLKNDYPEWGNI